jgi:hypothetical protein
MLHGLVRKVSRPRPDYRLIAAEIIVGRLRPGPVSFYPPGAAETTTKMVC